MIQDAYGNLFGVTIYTPYCTGCGAWFLGETGDYMDSEDYEQWYDDHTICSQYDDED